MKRWQLAHKGLFASLAAFFVSIGSGCRPEDEIIKVAPKAIEDRAVEMLSLLPASPQKNIDITLQTKYVLLDQDGKEHVRFIRKYKGLDIVGGDLVTHRKKGEKTGLISLANGRDIRIDITPSQTKEAAEKIASSKFVGIINSIKRSKLVIFAYSKVKDPRLAWDILLSGSLSNSRPSKSRYFVDANTLQILDSWEELESANSKNKNANSKNKNANSNNKNDKTTADTPPPSTAVKGNGFGIMNGKVSLQIILDGSSKTYQLIDILRGGAVTLDVRRKKYGDWYSTAIFSSPNNSFGNGKVTDRASAGADVHYAFAKTWDYFKNVHGRNGIRNDGKGAMALVHYPVLGGVNAFWDDESFAMYFGNGDGKTFLPLVSVDITAHEMTHGITRATADLIYKSESGGLNEATSDIFGTLVEFYANSAPDKPDYLIGEKIFMKGGFIRSMSDPKADNQSYDCYFPGVGDQDVHFSSGIANHFFYLLAEGSSPSDPNLPKSSTCDGSSVTGIGREAAGKIWYRALTLYMVSNTDYSGARAATIKAAVDLYGEGSTQANTVAAAWTAVSVKDAPVDGNIPVLLP